MKIPNLDSAVAAARALGHPARLRTVSMLRSGELCVCQITAVLKLAPSTVSAHLKELKLAGMINERKQGKWVYISLAELDPVRSWIETATTGLVDDPRLGEDLRMVAELRELPVEDLCRLGYEEARARADATPRP
jgi:DNA-binding transcriptional ArsR family regulator